jgi:uncharacterized peroxidase-related enzyme
MTYIETPDESVGSDVASLFEAERTQLGYVPNSVRLFAARPAVLRAWQQLNRAIKEASDARRYELATLAAARRLRSTYCALAHGLVLVERFYDAETVQALVRDPRSAAVDEVDVAVMELADKVVADATSISSADIDRLRSFGLTDEEILDVVVAAAARCFLSKTLDALGVEADAAYLELDPDLREALTVGRPIEQR